MKNKRVQITEYRVEKNIFLHFLGVFVFCVIALTGCIPHQTNNIDSAGTDIICFGDSLTFGYGVEAGQDYPTLLSQLLNKPVINAGVDGDTTVDAVKRLEKDVIERNPLLVIVEFAGNDFLEKVPMEKTLSNMDYIIKKVQAKGAMVAVVDCSAGMLLREYHAAFHELAKENNTIFIPQVLSGIITDSRLKSDFLHPNANGYAIIAQRIYRGIIPHLNRNQLSRSSAK